MVQIFTSKCNCIEACFQLRFLLSLVNKVLTKGVLQSEGLLVYYLLCVRKLLLAFKSEIASCLFRFAVFVYSRQALARCLRQLNVFLKAHIHWPKGESGQTHKMFETKPPISYPGWCSGWDAGDLSSNPISVAEHAVECISWATCSFLALSTTEECCEVTMVEYQISSPSVKGQNVHLADK